MFEGRYWADLDPATGEPLAFHDEPELSEEDYLAEVERMIAADPLNRPEPSAAEVIARGESEAMSPGLIGLLWQIDPSTLEEDQRLGYTIAMDRVANAAHARRALGAAAVTAASPDDVHVPRELHAAGQLGAALGMGRNATDQLVTAAGELDRLPAVREAALAGNLTWRKASSLATATMGLTDEQATQVAEKVLPKAWGQAVGKFDAAVRKAVDLVDPDGIEARKKLRKHVIRLVKHHYGDGMGQLFADMPSEKLDRLVLGTDRWARRRKNDGDPRPLDEIRVDALYCWASSFLSHGDPTYCDRICQPTSPDPSLIDPDDPDAWREPPTDTDDPGWNPDTDDPDDDPDDGGTPPPDEPDEPTDPSAAATEPSATVEPVNARPKSEFSLPTGHGRAVKLTVVWDLTSLLGLTRHAGLLLDSDTVIAPSTVEELIAGGLRVRRGIHDDHGWLIDATPKTWALPATDGSPHPGPVELLLTTTARLGDLSAGIHTALDELDTTDPYLAATLRELLDAPLTADGLDAHPDDEHPGAALAAYTCLRAGHPINPTGGPNAATAADLDHHEAKSQGGKTERTNLGPATRRWHRLKTFDGWTVTQTDAGWEWSSPTGRKYVIEPFDYRLGP